MRQGYTYANQSIDITILYYINYIIYYKNYYYIYITHAHIYYGMFAMFSLQIYILYTYV